MFLNPNNPTVDIILILCFASDWNAIELHFLLFCLQKIKCFIPNTNLVKIFM